MKHAPAAGLLALGLLTMIGDLAGIAPLKGIGTATAASPAPKVFSAVRGYETYSTRFLLEWSDRHERSHSLELTPELYARLEGPYNRRNAYGAAVSYGPVLASDPKTAPMFWSVARYALTGDAPLLRELGVDPATVVPPLRVRYVTRPGAVLRDLPSSIEIAPR